jgi:hypothetical protein
MTIACAIHECSNDVVAVCGCRRCNHEPDGEEKYHTCAVHRDEVSAVHLRVRERPAVWFSCAVPVAPGAQLSEYDRGRRDGVAEIVARLRSEAAAHRRGLDGRPWIGRQFDEGAAHLLEALATFFARGGHRE